MSTDSQVNVFERNTHSSVREERPESALLAHDTDRPPTPPSFMSGQNQGIAALPLQLDVSVPIPEFRVLDLLSLTKGTVLESNWPPDEDVPVWCGGAQLLWAEFEVIDDILAVRVTRVS
jgi:flagellar motor switch/type III secretory pathway protein FliN